MGGLPCAKVIIDQMVAAMALGSVGALEYVEEPEPVRDELLEADLDYLAKCIKIWEKYGVPLPISINPELLADLRTR